MTEIYASVNGTHYKIEAKNHADTSRVCTSVSTLMCTLEAAIRNNDDAVCVYSCLGPGYAKVEFVSVGPLSEEDVTMAMIGFLNLENSFPDEIRVEQNIFE